MRGVKRLRPVFPPSFPSWDLSVVLKGSLEPPFEPLGSAPERILMLKVTLLLALASFKHVGDLQALPFSEGDDLHLLCPVRALKMYVDRSSQWRKSLQLLVCFGAHCTKHSSE